MTLVNPFSLHRRGFLELAGATLASGLPAAAPAEDKPGRRTKKVVVAGGFRISCFRFRISWGEG